MGDTRKLLTICCPNHHDVLVNGLWRFACTKQHFDFDFRWGGSSIPAHKLIVNVFLSPEKLDQLQQNPDLPPETQPHSIDDPTMVPVCLDTTAVQERKGPSHFDAVTTEAIPSHPELSKRRKTHDIDNKDENNLGFLLEFLYKGKVTVGEKQLERLLQVAKDLDFKMLVDAVEATKKTENRRATRRRQRKGNPTKLVQYKETSEVDSNDEEWRSQPAKRSARLARARKKALKVLSEEEEDEGEQFVPEESESDIAAESGEEEEAEDAKEEEQCSPPPPPPAKRATQGRGSGSRARKPRKPRQKKATESVASSASKIDRRTLWRQSQPLLKCEHCNYESRHKLRFAIHRAKHDPTIVVFRCETCSRAFVSDDQLETHKAQAHGNGASVGIHQCVHCDYKTRDKGWFQVHLAKHDPTVVVHRCETCGNPYSSQESLDRHKVSQHGTVARTYKCSRCTFETEVKTKYYQHLYSTHKVNGYGEPMKERYKCPECEYTCSFRSGLRVHAKTHTQDKSFKCEQCDYASSHQGAIYRHVRTAHLHIKNHICHICGHRSATRAHLDRHLQSHTQEKPFKCDVCGQCYADRRYLNDHLRSHVSNEKTYICHICGHASSRREYLNSHLKAVHRVSSDTKRSRQNAVTAASAAAVQQLPVSPNAAQSNSTESMTTSSSTGIMPMGACLSATLPAGLTAPGALGDSSLISLQHMNFHNFVCL